MFSGVLRGCVACYKLIAPFKFVTSQLIWEATSSRGIVNLTCFEGIFAFAITLALLQAIEFTEVRFLD